LAKKHIRDFQKSKWRWQRDGKWVFPVAAYLRLAAASQHLLFGLYLADDEQKTPLVLA
jgi:hypothetical protein